MNRFNIVVACAALVIGIGVLHWAGGFTGLTVGALFVAFSCYLLVPSGPQTKPVAKLDGMSWSMEDFCRGWLITGDTGSGKTRSGITPLLFQVFKNVPNWGGLCIDDKGLYWETLSEMARHFKRQNDLILLQVRPNDALGNWKPTHTYNLISDLSIPFSTYAKAIVDTASSVGQQGNQTFFKQQAQTHISYALEALHRTDMATTLTNVYKVLLDPSVFEEVIMELADSSENLPIIGHLRNRYQDQPPEQMSGVKETIANYLQPFMAPPIAEVFCPEESSFDFDAIDRGKIICIAMPQKYQTERRYIATFLKLFFYTHLLKRFDKPKEARKHDNLLVLWADEAQRFVTAAEDGQSDYNCVDVIREAKGTIVAAAQSSTSFIPPLGREKAHVFNLNLRNRMIFKAADEEGAKESADFIGARTVIKKSWGYSGGKGSRNYSEQEEHRIKASALRTLKKHQCVLVHCEKGFRKLFIPPIEPTGVVCTWYSRRLF